MFYRPEPAEPAILRIVGDLIDLAIIVLGCGIVTLMFLNVLARTALDVDVAANVELGEFMLVWATFLGCAAAARRSAHMRITEVIGLFPAGFARPVEIATRLATLCILALLVWSGWIIGARTMAQKTTVLYWPVGLLYAAMPVGCLLSMPFVALEAFRLARREPTAAVAAEV